MNREGWRCLIAVLTSLGDKQINEATCYSRSLLFLVCLSLTTTGIVYAEAATAAAAAIAAAIGDDGNLTELAIS